MSVDIKGLCTREFQLFGTGRNCIKRVFLGPLESGFAGG